MLPQLNMSYHPYLYMQPSQFTFSPYFLPNSPTLYTPTLNTQIQFNPYQYHTNAFQMPSFPLITPNTSLDKTNISTSVDSVETAKLNKNIIKEKIIKKPANRPATYLTERKFYLTQTLPDDSSQPRRLRPRIIKKRHHRPTESTSHIKDCSQPLHQEAVLEVGQKISNKEKQSADEVNKSQRSQPECLQKRDSLTLIAVREQEEERSAVAEDGAC